MKPRPTHGKCRACGTWQPLKFLWQANTIRLYAHGGCGGANQQPKDMVNVPGLAEQVATLTAQMAIVEKFVAERAEFVSSARRAHLDFDRWNGHAEARRILAQQLGLPVTGAEDKQTNCVPCRHCGEPIHKLIDRSAAQPWWTHVHRDLIACDLVIPTAGSTHAEPGGAS